MKLLVYALVAVGAFGLAWLVYDAIVGDAGASTALGLPPVGGEIPALPFSTWPVPGHTRVGPGYGPGSVRGKKRFHRGIDIVAPAGTPIVSPVDATVTWAHTAPKGSCGIGCGLSFGDIQVWMCHFQSILVKPGQTVKKGQRIGYVGSTGNSTGPHLHLSVRYKFSEGWRAVNPQKSHEAILKDGFNQV